MADYVLNYFKMGLYTTENMKTFVAVSYITEEQFKTATGTDYKA